MHAATSEGVTNELLGHIEQALLAVGASRVWIDPASLPDLGVMAELPGPPPEQ